MTLLDVARCWLGFLALFELPAIHAHLYEEKRVTGFFGRLANGGAERRLWSMVLLLLVITRTLAFIAPTRESLTHCAAVHAAEAAFFGVEKLRYGGGGSAAILAVIVLNAFFFLYVAASA